MPTVKTCSLWTQQNNLLIVVFFACFLYWGYLFAATQMNIETDAYNYEQIARSLNDDGWVHFFEGGPNREPVYPILISISMKIEQFWKIPYQSVQKIMQVAIIFVSQLLTLAIFRRMGIRPVIAALVILYMGFSPGIVNSAFSLFSEIATYPFILGIILLSFEAGQRLETDSYGKISSRALGLGLLCIGITLVKGIFELIVPLYVISALAFLYFCSAARKTKPRLVNYVVSGAVCLGLFYSALFAYKSINKHYNGNFALTNRASRAIYGNTARRMEPMTARRFLSALAFMPGEGVCNRFFTKEECKFWSFEQSDYFGYTRINQLSGPGVTTAQLDRSLTQETIEMMFRHPFKQLVFMLIEGGKLMFWESTKIGFVKYPPWMMEVFYFAPFKDGLRFAMAILTLAAIIYSARQIFLCLPNAKRIAPGSATPETMVTLMLILIFFYTAAHSFFFVLTRYCLLMAPLYLILIGFCAQRLLFDQRTEDR